MTDEMEFTKEETRIQDDVDNIIYDMVYELGYLGENYELPWNIEWISAIREIAKDVIVNQEHRMTEQEFYPYREVETPNNYPKIETFVSDDTLMHSLIEAIECLDSDDLAKVAGYLLGGDCKYDTENSVYHFKSNSNYSGALGSWLEDEEEDDYNVGE